jgi:hypothetical protein
MGEEKSSGGWGKTIGITIVTGVGTLMIALLKPTFEKKGAEIAGVPKPTEALGASAKLDPVRQGEDASLHSSVGNPTGKTGSVASRIAVQPPVEPSRRETRELKHDLDVPIFENTPQIDFFKSDGEGRGRDRSVAIFKALEQSLSKQGASFSASVRLKVESETKRINGNGSTRFGQSVASDYSLYTDGLIRWWDVESEKDDGETVSVKVVAVIAKIKPIKDPNALRKTIAVLPFRVDSDPTLLTSTIPGATLGTKIRESLVTYLVNSRKFAVIDRTFQDEIARVAIEKPSLDLIQRAIQAAAKLGADYVAVGTADGIGVSSKRLGGLDVPIPDGMVNFRIIRIESGQTMLASSVTISDLPDLNLSGQHPENGIADALGRSLSDRTLEAIYPFKVAALNGPDEVILNRGGDDLSVGQRFDIANPGEEVKDPATGESLGLAERHVGTVEVVRVNPKAAYAKVLSKTEGIAVGAVCRKPSPGKTKESKAKSAGSDLNDLFK